MIRVCSAKLGIWANHDFGLAIEGSNAGVAMSAKAITARLGEQVKGLSHAQFFRSLQRCSATAADYRTAVSAGEWIGHFDDTRGTVKKFRVGGFCRHQK